MLDSGSDGGWQPGDQEAIRKALSLPATVPCLDQQLLAAGPEQEQAIEKQSSSGPIAGSVAADGDAPLQKANVIAYDTAPLQPFAKARLLLHETSIHGDTTSAVVASHVLEYFLERANYISAKESGPGVDTGDFTYIGYHCRSACLPPKPGAFWLSSDLVWQQHGRRLAADGTTLVAPCEGWIWLGNLSLLNPAGDADVDPYAQHTQFSVPEFGASYGSGGIGALVQPLIGERVFGTLKPNRLRQSWGVYTFVGLRSWPPASAFVSSGPSWPPISSR
ncbi:hypothetical protein [Synechococcus sp. CBW1107]|uniref:hypothetical protein n=1 Tax=Synechococcus sp. CBW1107 TaxID=2789857 RepID=UPI002AD249EF|nr:hypothetical protein [Synechococcus sp. CBW1107]CAK6698793.1 hypothetical protein ICNINCKA_02511 [Synechococcus sp. CBW1107]